MYQLRKYNDFYKDILENLPEDIWGEQDTVTLHALHSLGPATVEQVVKWIRENVPYIEKEYFIFEEDTYLPDGTEVGKKGQSRLESHVSFTLDRFTRKIQWKEKHYPIPVIPYGGVNVNPPRQKYKRGVYEVWSRNGVYVGQSVQISKRWQDHKRHIKKGIDIGKYFKPEEIDHIEFKVAFEVSQCRKLEKYEMLHAQKLKTMGYNVLNEDNWNLL